MRQEVSNQATAPKEKLRTPGTLLRIWIIAFLNALFAAVLILYIFNQDRTATLWALMLLGILTSVWSTFRAIRTVRREIRLLFFALIPMALNLFTALALAGALVADYLILGFRRENIRNAAEAQLGVVQAMDSLAEFGEEWARAYTADDRESRLRRLHDVDEMIPLSGVPYARELLRLEPDGELQNRILQILDKDLGTTFATEFPHGFRNQEDKDRVLNQVPSQIRVEDLQKQIESGFPELARQSEQRVQSLDAELSSSPQALVEAYGRHAPEFRVSDLRKWDAMPGNIGVPLALDLLRSETDGELQRRILQMLDTDLGTTFSAEFPTGFRSLEKRDNFLHRLSRDAKVADTSG